MKFKVQEKANLLEIISQKLGSASKSKIKKMLKLGNITLDGNIVRRPDLNAEKGQVIEISRAKKVIPKEENSFLHTLFEDEDFIVVVKPFGVSCSTAEKGELNFTETVSLHLQNRDSEEIELYILHRVEPEVSGIVIFAKNREAADRFYNEHQKVSCVYNALVEGKPPKEKDKISNYLKLNQIKKAYSAPSGSYTKKAVTDYQIKSSYRKVTLLEVRIENFTIRDQIRAHLSEAGCPIVGDKKYDAKTNPLKRLALHVRKLSFVHPFEEEQITLSLPLPRSFTGYAKQAK